ncbi:MAG TPA: hypothetical protein DIU39_09405, partial [Flavobacteriales bacterium]|nr:hypothetical protein [Flavobacteriales bacterium]
MNYTVKDIAQIVSGEILNESSESNNVHSVITDSRIAHIRKNEMFVALVGKNFNAHDFIENVYQKGGRIFLVSQAPQIIHSDASYILVEDTLQALQTLAAYHRQQFEIPVVGITGSNGKTVVKEWLTQLLQQKFTVCKSPKSYNSQVGVPLSVLQLSNEHQLAFFEAGISHPGEMERLANIINPNVGILTNIGDAHQVNFSSKKEKLKEKLKLFSKASKLFFLQDVFLTKSLLLEHLPATEVISIGFDKKAFPDIFCQKEKDDLYIEYKGEKYRFKLPFTDEVSVKNLALVLSVIIHQNWLTRQEITNALSTLEPVSMRMELIKGRNNLTIVNDAYNYDLTGLKHALHFAWKNRQNKPFSIILSDFVQHSENSKANAHAIATLVNNYTVQNLFLVGNELKKFRNLFNAQKIHFFTSVD